MSKTTAPSLRKQGGGIKGVRRTKRKSESIGISVPIQIGEKKSKVYRGLGGSRRTLLLRVIEGNMLDPKTKKFSKVKLISVKENKANRAYARRNIITKGCVVETSEGNGIVINRPGKSGQVTLLKQ
jgi:small subunit ribosomal protein S8e